MNATATPALAPARGAPSGNGGPGTGLTRRAVWTLGEILGGPWPFYPSTVFLLAAYGMTIRAIVRTLTHVKTSGVPYYEVIVPNLVTAVAVALVAAGGLVLFPRLAGWMRPLHDQPSGRGRYLAIIIAVSLTMSIVLIVMSRIVLPDAHAPTQVGVFGATLATIVFVLLTVSVTNGVTGRLRARLQRQEALIAEQLAAVRGERMIQLAAEERVRAETARFLHDNMQSTLLRASIRLDTLRRVDLTDADRDALDHAIAEIDDVRETGVRAIGRRLSPPLGSTGLIVALRELAGSYAGVMTVGVHVDDAVADRYRQVVDDDRVPLAVYRIIEQTLQNALKHGRAVNARLDLRSTDGDVIHLTVTADGVAPLPEPQRHKGDGTAIINAWFDEVGGDWALDAGTDGGSVFRATVGSRGA
jgi:signal transduction histidine kinase